MISKRIGEKGWVTKKGDRFKTTFESDNITYTVNFFHGADGLSYDTLEEIIKSGAELHNIMVNNIEFNGACKLDRTRILTINK